MLGRVRPAVVVGGMSGAWIQAARPKTLPAAIVPVWVGCVLVRATGGQADLRLGWLTVAGAVCIQIATNFFNDAIDARKGADTAARLGPQRVTASGRMPRGWVMAGGAWFLLLAVACGVPLVGLRGWPMVAIGIPSLFLAYGYTGGPWPLAYRGLGECFVLLFFGWVAVCGTVFVQTGAWSWPAVLLGWQVGLLSAVLISINNLRDRAEDAGTGKRTLAVRWGHRAALAMIFGEVAGAAAGGFGWMALGLPRLAWASLPVVVVGGFLCRRLAVTAPGPAYNRFLAMGALQLVLFATVFQMIS